MEITQELRDNARSEFDGYTDEKIFLYLRHPGRTEYAFMRQQTALNVLYSRGWRIRNHRFTKV